MTDVSFSTLGIAEPILRALSNENYHTPTPIQAQAIPILLEGRDLLGIAQTGTGKTAAFGLPLLQKVSQRKDKIEHRSVRALVLAPTRELAIQIFESLRTYSRFLGVRQAVVFGGVNQYSQVNALKNGVDILVATPGRLLDLIQQRHVHLAAVSTFVLDEADRMLDMGFIRDVRKIVAMLPRDRQSMLFSATMPDDVVKLTTDMLKNPHRVEVTPQATTVEKIDQRVYYVPTSGKRDLLHQLLRGPEFKRVIVFTQTKHRANRIAEQLCTAGFSADALHGNKSQNARQRALENFRTGKAPILVATDIMARGIDVDDVSHVMNFDLPNIPESYVHRIGRTARAGATGIAISFCDASERGFLRGIEREIRQKITVVGEAPAGNETIPEQRAKPNYAKRRPFRGGHHRPRQQANGEHGGGQQAHGHEEAGARARGHNPNRHRDGQNPKGEHKGGGYKGNSGHNANGHRKGGQQRNRGPRPQQ